MKSPADALSVSTRPGWPIEVRDSLLDCARDTWRSHPRFHGKAEFFLNYHQLLLTESAKLRDELEQVLNAPTREMAGHPKVNRARRTGLDLIYNTERHHRIEDAHYFPEFAAHHPELRPVLDLLDNDHNALGACLENLGTALQDAFPNSGVDKLVAQAHSLATLLDHQLKRHLFDEEEVIIPIFLGRGMS